MKQAPRDWSTFESNSKSVGEVYYDALKELAKPFPSIRLRDSEMFNSVVGGFRTREFSILCGSTGTGKTTLLSNWAQKLLLDRQKLFVMSVETGATDFVKRTMSAFLGRDINKGDSVPLSHLKDFENKYGSHFKTEDLYLGLYDNRVKHELVMDEILFHVEKRGCKIVFIDNLNFLMEVVSQQNQVMEMDRVVHDMIMLCKRTDVHIVMVMHPKKTDGRVESEFDVKGSSTAVQEAHNVFLFNRPLPNDADYTSFHRELKFQKLRRRGEHVGRRLMYKSVGTQYVEEILL